MKFPIILSKLFGQLPQENFKVPMKNFKSLGSYTANGKTYETFKHKDSKLQLLVEVDTVKVVGIKTGRMFEV